MLKKFIYTSLFLTTTVLSASLHVNAESEFISESFSSIGAPTAELDRQNVASLTVASTKASTQQQLKSALAQNLQQLNTSFSIQYTGNTSNIMNQTKKLIQQIMLEDDYLNGIVSGYGYSAQGHQNNVTITFKVSYYHTKTQEQYITQKVKQINASILSPSMTEVQKVKAINDYIVLNSTYSDNTSTSPHSLYTILHEGKGVCQAYALLAYRLLQDAGFDARYVTGYAGEPHAWNLVKVDGQWYHLDTTWNDPVFSSSAGDKKNYIHYEYFLLSDSQIRKDHSIDANGYPSATSTRFTAWHSVSEPIQMNDTMYFANSNDNIRLYKMNTNSSTYKVEKVADVRVQHLTYANGWLYFSNYSHSGYLFKIRLNGSELTKLASYNVTKITKTNDKLIAYSGNKQIFSTTITPEQTDDKQPPTNNDVASFTQQVKKIEYLNKDFKRQAESLLDQYNRLSPTAKQTLTKDIIALLEEMKEKLDQLNNVSYPNSKQWRDKQYITNPRKQWTLTLNDTIQAGTDLSKHIWMEDMFGEKVATNIEYLNGRVVITPTNDLVTEIPYTIVIKDTLKNAAGKKLKRAVHLPFEVKAT